MANPETHAAIKAKFPKLHFSKKRLDLIGDKLEPKVTTELTLDALIDSFNEFQPIEDLVKTDDREATMKKKLDEASKKPPVTQTQDDPEDEDPTEEVVESGKKPPRQPAYVKKLLEGFTALTEKVGTLEKEKSEVTIKSTLKEKLKDVPEIIWAKRVMPSKAEDIDAFVTEVTSEFGEHEKKATESGVKILGKPPSGTSTANGASKATKEEIDAVVKDIM